MDTRCFIIYLPVLMIISASSTRDVPDIWPAEIYGSSTVNAHENVLLKCIVFDRRVSSDQIHVYLIKNGVAVMMETLGNKDKHTFTSRNVSVRDSGNYSCVYSKTKYPTQNVTASGKNSICVQVIDVPDIRPAEIYGCSTVKAQENVLLKCNFFDQCASSDQIHMYLIKNGVAVMMETLGNKDEHTFILGNVSVRDSGNYSCVYSKIKYPTKDVRASGKNSIYVQVIDPQWQINLMRLLGSLGVIIFAGLIVIFDVYSSKQGYRKSCTQSGII